MSGWVAAELPAGVSPQPLYIVSFCYCAFQLLHFYLVVELALSSGCC